MESLKVKDYMNHYPVIFTANMVIEEASVKFLNSKQIGGPVVDNNNCLVGFLSETDVLSVMLESSYYNEHFADVASMMTKEVMTVKPYDSIMEVGQKMVVDKRKMYPVVDDDGLLQGTICRHDVLQAIDRHLRAGFHLSNQPMAR